MQYGTYCGRTKVKIDPGKFYNTSDKSLQIGGMPVLMVGKIGGIKNTPRRGVAKPSSTNPNPRKTKTQAAVLVSSFRAYDARQFYWSAVPLALRMGTPSYISAPERLYLSRLPRQVPIIYTSRCSKVAAVFCCLILSNVLEAGRFVVGDAGSKRLKPVFVATGKSTTQTTTGHIAI